MLTSVDVCFILPTTNNVNMLLRRNTMSIAKTTDTKVNKNIIKLNEDYGIGADDLNIILYERKMNKTETSNNYGKEYYSPIGYYGNIESLLKNLVNKRIMLEVSENTTLEALVNSIDVYVSLLYTSLQHILKGLKDE